MKIILILSSIILNSAAQLFMRKGMIKIGNITLSNYIQKIPVMLASVYLWFAMICFGLSLVLWMAVLSKVETSYAVPFQSVGFLVVALAGYFLFDETLSLQRIIGIAIICIGVYFVSRS